MRFARRLIKSTEQTDIRKIVPTTTGCRPSASCLPGACRCESYSLCCQEDSGVIPRDKRLTHIRRGFWLRFRNVKPGYGLYSSYICCPCPYSTCPLAGVAEEAAQDEPSRPRLYFAADVSFLWAHYITLRVAVFGVPQSVEPCLMGA